MGSLILRRLGAVILLAAAYYVTGRLGLLLAIPPGYATAVWPPSGIALAGLLLLGYRAWPGVMLGSFSVNVFTSLDPSDATTILRSVSVAAVIGLGAAAQAVVGAFFVRRYAGFPRPIERERQIGAFLVLGGLTSCLVGATVGTTTLLCAGVLDRSLFWASWWTWWSGDTIGVFLFTPLLLVWSGGQPGARVPALLSVALPSMLGFAVVVTLFVHGQRAEQERARLEFERQTDRHVDLFGRTWVGYAEILRGVASFVASAGDIDQRRWSAFVEPLRKHSPGVAAVSWNRRILDKDRAAYEEAERRRVDPRFRITEMNAKGQLVTAESRPEYVVVTYIDPLPENAAALGYDVASNPARLEALLRARASGEPTATEPITLVQNKGDRSGVLVFLPVYSRAPLVEEGGEATAVDLMGYVTAVFETEDVVAASLGSAETEGVLMRLYDDTRPAEPRLIHEDRPGGAAVDWEKQVAFKRSLTIDAVGRRWRMELGLEKKELIARTDLGAWGLLTGGLLFVGMLEAFLLLVTARSAGIALLVAERTEKLSRANESLAKEVVERTVAEEAAKFLEAQLVQNNAELAEKNRRLEKATRLKSEFLANMSHELRTPLNAIIGFSQLLRDGKLGPVTTRQERHLDDVLSSAEHLLRLINDVLDLAKVEAGKIVIRPERVSVAAAIDEVTDVLRPLLARKRIQLSVAIDPALGEVVVDPDKLRQILYNYLSNAIKFTPSDGRVAVRVAPRGDLFRLEVEDSGSGIAEDDIARLFVEFQQLEPGSGKPHEGTGLGLALTKRIVEAQGGVVGVERASGRGSVFYAELPRAVVPVGVARVASDAGRA